MSRVPSTKRKPKLKPIEARTFKQVCALSRDNLDTKGHWILIDGNDVCLTAQVLGKAPTNSMRIARREFDRLARWYVTGRAGK